MMMILTDLHFILTTQDVLLHAKGLCLDVVLGTVVGLYSDWIPKEDDSRWDLTRGRGCVSGEGCGVCGVCEGEISFLSQRHRKPFLVYLSVPARAVSSRDDLP